jgi:hypothetical protein
VNYSQVSCSSPNALELGRLDAAVRRERRLSLVLVTSHRSSLEALSLLAALLREKGT